LREAKKNLKKRKGGNWAPFGRRSKKTSQNFFVSKQKVYRHGPENAENEGLEAKKFLQDVTEPEETKRIYGR